MSQIGDMKVSVLAERLSRYGIVIEPDKKERGVAMRRGEESYRFAPFEDFVLGTQIAAACQYFGIDPFDLL